MLFPPHTTFFSLPASNRFPLPRAVKRPQSSFSHRRSLRTDLLFGSSQTTRNKQTGGEQTSETSRDVILLTRGKRNFDPFQDSPILTKTPDGVIISTAGRREKDIPLSLTRDTGQPARRVPVSFEFPISLLTYLVQRTDVSSSRRQRPVSDLLYHYILTSYYRLSPFSPACIFILVFFSPPTVGGGRG